MCLALKHVGGCVQIVSAMCLACVWDVSSPPTRWSLSRRLLGVERVTTNIFYPFHAILERGSISEHILNNINKVVLLRIIFEK